MSTEHMTTRALRYLESLRQGSAMRPYWQFPESDDVLALMVDVPSTRQAHINMVAALARLSADEELSPAERSGLQWLFILVRDHQQRLADYDEAARVRLEECRTPEAV
ncbi:MAG: hypothetical protein AAF515_11015 [Pseudomonadota bacterium]